MTLVLDIETWTPGKTPNPDIDELRVLGLTDLEGGLRTCFKHTEFAQASEVMQQHRVVVTFNGDHYDIPILRRHGYPLQNIISLDLKEIIKKRGNLLRTGNMSISLANCAKFFKLETRKMEQFNYKILEKTSWTDEEWAYIVDYTLTDIDVTKQLFEKMVSFFEPFKALMSDNDRLKYKWLTCSSGTYAYKAICNLVGLKEEYEEINGPPPTWGGGYVAQPAGEEFHNDIYCLDFNSMYPHAFLQANLYSWNCTCCNDDERWHGNELFPVQGYYCSKQRGKIESKILELFNLRSDYKRQGRREEYAIKIVLNTMYGISGNPVFKSVFHVTTPADCTLIGRQSVKLARTRFAEAGYTVVYTDTDSVYIQDPFKDEARILDTKKSIVDEIKRHLPFPSNTFDMGVDAKIKHLWFIKRGERFNKKHYIYVTNDNKLTIKGLPIIKGDSMPISTRVFEEIKADIIEGRLRHHHNDLERAAYTYLRGDVKLAARDIRVYDLDKYKGTKSFQAQVAIRYGPGKHTLIPNSVYGIGKKVKYCTIQEFNERQLSIRTISLHKMWRELEPFTVRLEDTCKPTSLLNWSNA